MGGKRKIIRRITGWFLLVLFLVLLAGLVLTWLKLPEFLKKEASDFVDEKSDGLYSLSIEKIKTEFFPFALNIQGIELTPDKEESASIQKNNPDKTIYSLTSGSIRMEGINLRSLWKEGIFHSRKIFISEPVIEISGGDFFQDDSTNTADNIVAEIRPLFNTHLKQIKIDRIEFSDANFGLSVAAGAPIQKSQAGQVMLEVRGFRTDSTMIFRDSRFFEKDDVLVKMRNFRNNMGDSLHVTTIDTLEYSLKSTDIRAVGFHLFPLYSIPEKNLFDVKVPEVYVKSKSITHFALNDSMKISFLQFNNPEIRFFHKENPERFNLEKLNDFNLYTLVQNQFKKMEVDSFMLSSANLEIYRQPDTINFQQQFRSIDIRLEGFALDSTSAQNRDKLFHADNLEMRVGGYQLRLEDNQHDFSADSLFVSTFTNRLGVNQIKINPANPLEFDARTEVNILCNELNIENVDLKRLYYTRRLPTSKIEIIEPEVNLQYHLERERQKHKQQRQTGLLYEIVSDYLLGVYSNLVYIENGKLSIQNRQNKKLQGYFETGFTFSLTDFTLDSTSLQRTDKFFYATNFDLDFSNYNMRLVDDLHKLEINHATISSLNQQVKIAGLQLQPVPDNVTISTMQQFNRSEIYNIRVPEIALNGVDLNNAFFDKKLKINDFKISNPEIYFENFGALRANRQTIDLNEFYDLIFNYIEDFDIDRFSIPNGKITWVNHTRKGRTTSLDNEFSASLLNFRLNKNELNKERLFFSDNFDISIKDQLFELSDSVHILKAGEIRLSSINSTVSIKNGLLYPVITSEKYELLPTTFQVTIPELTIRDFNFREAYYTQNPQIGSVEIEEPKFQIYNQAGKTKSLDLNKYHFPLPKFINSVKLDEFKITNAGVITYETRGIDHRAKGSFNFNLSLPEVTIESDENKASIESENIQLQLNDFHVPVGENHSLEADQLNFNREQKAIEIQNLKVKAYLNDSKSNSFRINAPEIHFTGFNLLDALNKNQFNFNKINIVTPSVDIAINKKPGKDTVEFLQTLDLFPFVEPYLDQIKVNNLSLKDADVNFNWLQKKLFDNKINLEFKNILIAENQPPASFLNSEEFTISTNDLKTQSKNGLYEFTAGSLSYNSAKHSVLLSNISISPLVDKKRFPVIKGFQTDVVNAQIEFAEMQGIDEKRWLKENVLDAASLQLGPAKVNIFRNKRYPFNQQQRPPWPQDLIKGIKQPFVFDSVSLKPSQIIYSELTSIYDEPGVVDFQELSFNGGKISNMQEILGRDNMLTLDARAKLYGDALLEARFRFDMTSPDYFHTASGSLHPMDLSAINNMLEKSAPMRIEEGKLSRFEFDLTLNAENSEGLLFMGYDDLKIAVLDYNQGEQQKAGLASFWANKMILNSKSPKGAVLEPVSIYYERDKKRSIINFWWKSLYSGVKEVLGIEPKGE
jgi:hypothetical protein